MGILLIRYVDEIMSKYLSYLKALLKRFSKYTMQVSVFKLVFLLNILKMILIIAARLLLHHQRIARRFQKEIRRKI
jgi:hypothetical protein